MDPNQPASIVHPPAKLNSKLVAGVILLFLISLYVMNASKPGSRVEGCASGCETGMVRVGGGLRIVSLNMLHGFPRFKNLTARIDLIGQEIRKLDADVILLQEVPWTVGTGNVAKHLAQRLGYNYLYYRANGNKNLILFEEGEAILSRFELKDPRSIAYGPRASYFDTRVALGATIITPWGDVAVNVTHLTNENLKVASLQVGLLQQFVAEGKNDLALVSGDFNSPDDSPRIIALSQVWKDTYRAIHPQDSGFTCCINDLSMEAAKPLDERIDYIFIAPKESKGWQLQAARRVFDQPFRVNGGWLWASDHVGLMVELKPPIK